MRNWLVAAIGGIVALVLISIAASIIDNPFFVRMTPVRAQDYVIWVVTGFLAGLVVGTYALPAMGRATGRFASGGFLSFLAVGCQSVTS